MRTILFIVFSLFTSVAFSQTDTSHTTPGKTPAPEKILSVTIKAGGLTCSMCSKAIYKSLLKVPEVSKVDPDIEHSEFIVFFKRDRIVNPASLEKAVRDAGFSVESLKVNKATIQ